VRHLRSDRSGLIAAVTVLGLCALARAQAPSPSPLSFPTQAEAITVDVVVVDRAGHPVRGLTRDEFTVLEDGRPQAIVGFEPREMAEPAVPPLAGPAAPAENAASNQAAGKGGRTLVVLVDDQGTSPVAMQQVKEAIGRWLRERAAPSDEMTILSVTGDVWWSDTVARGREDLLAVLARIQGKRTGTAGSETMSEQEAYRITTFESGGEGFDFIPPSGEIAAGGGPGPLPAVPILTNSISVVDRVARRWLDLGLCCWCSPTCTYDCDPPLRKCKSRVRLSAVEVQAAWTRRATMVLDALERLSSQLAALPGRKQVLLVTEEFQRDVLLEGRVRTVVDAAQRGNTAVYFSGALGLTGLSTYGVESTAPPRPGDIGAMMAEEQTLSVAGGSELAEMTGGATTGGNDLAAGLERMAEDSSAYYLLGYQPERLPDGRWRKLEVKVARPGVKVRARRGYRALPLAPARRAPADERKAPPPLLAGGDRGALPLRMASYVQGPDGAGSARVLIVLELDSGRVRLEKTPEGARASLDLSILAVARDRPKVIPLGQELDVTLKEGDAEGWWALFRDVRLPPGVAQIRATVRDRATGVVGTVHQRVEVPDVDAPYLSTLVLSDRTQPPLAPGEPPRLVPAAHRGFPARGPLFCQYELFSFAGRSMPGVARVSGSYMLRRPDGRVLTLVPPTAIATDGHRVVRRLAIPLDDLEPGPYELVVTVEDHLARRTLSARESFHVEPASSDTASPGSPPAP
jgi:VWFA-related protein